MKMQAFVIIALIAVITALSLACRNGSKNIAAGNGIERKKIAEYYYPVIYDSLPSGDGQWGFQTVPAGKLRIKLIPNIKACEELGLTHIDNIAGVNQFLLDMDLSNGFVHPYTVNFFNKLSPDDYVLKYEKTEGKKWEGLISFVRKKYLGPQDTLGKNLAYFRQWPLSELLHGDSVHMQSCGYAQNCLCPQARDNYFKEIPISNCNMDKSGVQHFAQFDKLSEINGGTVSIIWADSVSGEIFFKDIHGSLSLIIREAKKIATAKHVDPVIAISDAGIVSRKFRAENFVLDLSPIKQLAPHSLIAAGYGYVPVKFTVYAIREQGKPERLDTVREEIF